jgi:non-ribosomal peptide synthetase component E (peptide arylation enzyme)
MIDQELVDITEDFDDFLMKIVSNYEVSFPGLVGIIMARMVALSQQAKCEDVILKLLPVVKESIIKGMDKPLH